MKRNLGWKQPLTLGAVAVLSLGLAACGGSDDDGDSGGGGSVTMNLGHVFPEGSEIDEAADTFAAQVSEKTDGAVTINVFPGGQIGSDEEMATALNGGTQEAAILSQGAAGFGDDSQLGNMPYLVNDFEQADSLFYGDGWMAEWDKRVLEENGIVGLEFVENGFRGLSNNDKPVTEPADVDGLKVRAPSSDLIIGIFDDWGAQAVAIPFPELYTALEQGTVDAQENGVTLFNQANFHEVQKHYTDTRYTYATAVFAVSQATWDSLSEEQQQILQEEAEAASLTQRETVRAGVDAAIADLKEKIDVVELTDEQLEVWRGSVSGTYERARETYGDDVIDELEAAAEEVRG